ncbi:MAG: Hsp20/alpha crystallin family protein [candidate division WOR-3 bacterium]|uniref:Hsp20/alpha crystallin family protein n=1 Tax=candidate division WOR-3 bacterium TaxID=2052148 RepID=A0A7C3J1Y6_UNCW3|nr:Hsp20/alpha crystallin family protein [candidate division WOR-3 bacterium]
MAKHLTTWDPFREMVSLRDELDRLFDSVFGRLPRERGETYWAPPLDIEETEDAIVVRAELPGMNKEDIKVSLSGDTLTISGERKFESEKKNRTYYRQERIYGKFQRTVTLPAEVEGDKAKASYKAGVLELVLPKSEKSKAKEITIVAED